MIKAVIFDLDNTLLDFMNMKTKAVESAIHGMIEAGLTMERDRAKEKVFAIYKKKDLSCVRKQKEGYDVT